MSLRHKPELDGIRGLAILGVLATHSYPYIELTARTRPIAAFMSFGQWGVDLFFALSGFLITGILIETKTATNYFSSFYARRVLRISPIYYSVLAILFSMALISPKFAVNMPVRQEWGSYLVYLQNVPIFWSNGYVISATMIGHFWSLAVEEQFYFIWPIIVLLAPESSILGICAVGFAVALPLKIYLLHVFGTSWAEMIITTARMDGLFVGAAYAVLLHRLRHFSFRFFLLPALAGILILGWIAIFHRSGEFIGSGPYMRTFGVTAVALLAGALIGLSQLHVKVVDRILQAGWLRFFGRYSYGIYVFHIPVFVASRGVAHSLGLQPPFAIVPGMLFILVMNATSILIAVASFELFESKFLRLKNKFQPIFHGALPSAVGRG